MALELRELGPRDQAAFVRAVEQGEDNFAHYYEPGLDFTAYLNVLRDRERGLGLPERHVPSTLYFGFVGSEIVGRLSLRHELNDFLEKVGGHIGYVVLPAHRRKGYATEMLKQSLGMAQQLGLKRALLTCDEGNQASRRTIEKCGGIFESSYHGPEVIEPKRRYWIPIRR